MTNLEKIKKIIAIALGFALSTYLIMSGIAILDVEDGDKNSTKETVSHP